MSRKKLENVLWWEPIVDGEVWRVVFTAPGLCPYWSGEWCGLTVYAEKTIYIDPRPSSHRPDGWIDTVVHELAHSIRGPRVNLRRDEAFIRKVTPALIRIINPQVPPIPDGLEPLRRRCYRFDAEKRKAEAEFWS